MNEVNRRLQIIAIAIANGIDGFITIVGEAYTTVSELETWKAEIQSVIDEATMGFQAPSQQMSSQNPAHPSMFSLSELKVEKFDGNILLYREWKERMTSDIFRRADIPDKVKVQLTVDRLMNKAFK
uniref:Uncharacterized protein n=1 Tax=Acrobeloides nanus TaxID=290746 RepID=A0A914CZE3_9BILA